MIADDLFAGAGGWDLAAAQLGIHARGVENMKEARATREAAGLTTIHDDVWTFEASRGSTGLIASPPCQTFSTAGKGAGRKALDDVLTAVDWGEWKSLSRLRTLGGRAADDRTALVLTPLHFATAHPYGWLAWEQVPPVLPIWEACAVVLRFYGFNVWTGVLNAEQYGVPQTRKRAFLLASRHHEVAPPAPTHSKYHNRTPERLDEGVLPWVSMAEGIGWGLLERPAYTITGGSQHAASGIGWGGASTRKVLLDSMDNPDAWRQKGWGLSDRPSPTVTGGGTETGGAEPIAKLARYTNRDGWIPRAMAQAGTSCTGDRDPEGIRLTPSEAGILQSFPADYPWQGKKGRQFLQAGNAVPPGLAMHALAAAAGIQRSEVAA